MIIKRSIIIWMISIVVHLQAADVSKEQSNCSIDKIKDLTEVCGAEVQKVAIYPPIEKSVEQKALDLQLYRGFVYNDSIKDLISIIEKGADVAAVKLYSGQSALQHALSRSRKKIDSVFILYLIGKCREDVNYKDQNDETACHYAVKRLRSDVIKILFKHNANVNAENVDGNTSLHLAADIYNEYEHQTTKMDYDYDDVVNVIDTLLECGADRNVANHQGYFPASWGRISNCEKIAQYIENWDVNAKDGNGNTRLHKACLANETRVVEALLTCGARAEELNRGGLTPIDYANMLGYQSIVACLKSSQGISEEKTI